jgi:GT2 family glycosyltransferase
MRDQEGPGVAGMAGSAQAALRQGQALLLAGNKAEAQRWLDRAYRLAPEDSSVRLLLASALAGADDRQCRSLLLSLMQDYPRFREARIALAAAELRTADSAAAIGHLAALLTSTAPPDSANFRQLADQIVVLAQAPGWIGVDSDGRVQISLPALASGGVLELWVDGRRVWSPRTGPGPALLHCRLPKHWRRASVLTAEFGGRALLGSGIDLVALRRVQGFVAVGADGSLSGWAWHPADPEATAILSVMPIDRGGSPVRIRADDDRFQSSSEDGPARLRGFSVPFSKLPSDEGVRINGGDGDELLGSPVFPLAEQRAARAAAAALGRAEGLGLVRSRRTVALPSEVDRWRPLSTGSTDPAALGRARPARPIPARRKLDVVMPVYRGVADFRACLASLRRRWPDWARLVVVDDGSPDAALRAELDRVAATGGLLLLRHARNQGFPAAANSGMRHASARKREPRDVVLLNPDTLLPVGWLERMVAAAYSGADIGSVTPLTNQGTIVAYPKPNEDNPAPDLAGTDRLDALMRLANGRGRVELPTAVGFCMLIRHDCLAEVGLFREDAFAQGYGEENDWCLRARQLGWQHVAATGVFVAHHGGRSFGAGRRHLLARNGEILNRLHPGYDGLIADFAARDPLSAARQRADRRRWAENRRTDPLGQTDGVLLVTHDAGGGVERFVDERSALLRAQGRRAILLRPQIDQRTTSGEPVASATVTANVACRISIAHDDEYPNLRFRLPDEVEPLIGFLMAESLREVEVHHLLGHAPTIIDVIARLTLPYRVYIHDYSYWCPRITLCTKGPRYCGEPIDVRECDACVMDLGRRAGPEIAVGEMRTQSATLLSGAVSVVVPCAEVADRMARHFDGVRTTIQPWEDDERIKQQYRQAARRGAGTVPTGGPTRVMVVGAVGDDKGYEVLLGCVRDADRRGLELNFTVVGFTKNDARLLNSGPIFITGGFTEDEAVALAAAQQAHIGFIPSIWPETWCYALSTVWRAGLMAVAFAFGAQAERIRRTGLGSLLPVGLAPERINDRLMQLRSAAWDAAQRDLG